MASPLSYLQIFLLASQLHLEQHFWPFVVNILSFATDTSFASFGSFLALLASTQLADFVKDEFFLNLLLQESNFLLERKRLLQSDPFLIFSLVSTNHLQNLIFSLLLVRLLSLVLFQLCFAYELLEIV